MNYFRTARPLTLLIPAVLFAQNPPARALIQRGQAAFSEHCADCHGSDGEGSDRGPKLAGTRHMRSQSVDQLRNIISQGRASSGMPAFHLPGSDLDALAPFVHSLNSTAAESGAPGDPVAGRDLFFGKEHC